VDKRPLIQLSGSKRDITPFSEIVINTPLPQLGVFNILKLSRSPTEKGRLIGGIPLKIVQYQRLFGTVSNIDLDNKDSNYRCFVQKDSTGRGRW